MILHPQTLQLIIDRFRFKELNQLQERCLKQLETNKHIIISAPTGSGKTLAFLLPLISKLNAESKGIQALVIAPTRELAIQIGDVFKTTGVDFKMNVFYGGHDFKTETKSLSQPPAVLIGTPGRLADHLRRGTIDLRQLQVLVIDEFDKSLELGFETEMQAILGSANVAGIKILTSATPISPVPNYLGMATSATISIVNEITSKLKLYQVNVAGTDRLQSAQFLLSNIGNEPTLLFCNHREAAERIQSHLKASGASCDLFHGGLKQEERERALIKMRNGSINILVTTDLAARGLDIPEIKHVIHYQPATNEAAFVHRNGRTARVHAEGAAYLLIDEKERIPSFIDSVPEVYILPLKTVPPTPANWETIYFGAGKKEKINKIDLVGVITQIGELKKEEIGRIDVLDHHSFVAVARGTGKKLISKLEGQPIKKKRFKIGLSN
jgi:superfamily II DNA/RNA helicase